MKKTRANGPYETLINTILTNGRKDVNMARKEIQNLSYNDICKLYLILARNWLYYAGLAFIVIWVIKSLFKS